MTAEQPSNSDRPFELNLNLKAPVEAASWRLVQPIVEKVTGLSALGHVYSQAQRGGDLDTFIALALRELGIESSITDSDLAKIPKAGACLVVANHPLGGAEGLLLGQILRRVRTDSKILANHWLSRMQRLRDLFLFVDPFSSPEAARNNLPVLREALRRLKQGHLVAVFPAGEVAHFQPQLRRVSDGPWNEAAAWLARVSGAPVLPVHFGGQNSALFQLAGMLHPRLRTALLPRELLNKRGTTIAVRVGALVPAKKLKCLSDAQESTLYLRKRTEILAERPANEPPRKTPLFARPFKFAPEPLIAPLPPAELLAEIERLPAASCLVEDGDRIVCCVRADQIPKLLQEIGRLREETFRAVDEGTGKPVDLDDFDQRYLHLFSFDRKERAVMGAYRLGLTDELLRRSRGVYTETLFEIHPELFHRMGPALEMGRSFVAARYQRSASGLFLLWRGIGKFLVENPRYRVLFGPVSISNAYAPGSRELIVNFIRQSDHHHPFAGYVKPRHPFVPRRRPSFDTGLPALPLFRELEEIDGLVADIEPDRKGVPMLLKQYLRLGGKILSFNIDPAFSQALDGLVLVDLAETDPKILGRYLGTEQAAQFLACHTAPVRFAS